jgi:hypothetical protein
MHHDIPLGSLTADGVSEFSKGTTVRNPRRYRVFLDKSAEYRKSLRSTYGHPAEAEIPAAIQPSPAVIGQLLAIRRVLV